MRSHISLAVSSCLYMADAISEKERRRRDFELACVEGRRTPSARRSDGGATSSWHVWSGKADAISEKERQSRGFELACVEREGGRQQREEAAKPWIRAGMCGGKADANSEKKRRSRGFELACVEGRRTPTARRSGEAVDSSWHGKSRPLSTDGSACDHSRFLLLLC